MNPETLNKVLNLIDQLISYNEIKDNERTKESDVGQSFNIFHLKLVKKLLEHGKE